MNINFKILSAICLLFIASTSIQSCSKDHDDKPDNETSPSGSTWKFGDYSYTSGGSTQETETTDGRNLTVIVSSTTGDGGNYGAYSGSALTMSFYSNLGTGKYVISNTEDLVTNPGAKIIVVECTIGTAVNTGAILYTPAANTGVTADVTKDDKGKYHVTINSPVTLAKNVEVTGGIPGASDTYKLTAKDIY
ncbi:hypothetical protein SAMN05216436_106172 [bacterium A37T11]|nr:hypothetical protein SAMN05216436_106172 [bacterium A37T11]